MTAQFNSNARNQANHPKPWFATLWNDNPVKQVIVIGCGISGATTAYSLAKRGYHVTIYESAATLDNGHDQLVLYGNFSGNHAPLLELNHTGYRYSHSLIQSLLTEGIDYQACGVIQLGHNTIQLKQQKALTLNTPTELYYAVNQAEIEAIAGIPVNCQSGLYYPYGVCLNPSNLIKKLTDHPNIKLILNTSITEISHTNQWHVKNNGNILDSAPTLVLCNSYQLQQFSQIAALPLIKTRGQVSKVKGCLGLKTVICANGYITPHNGQHYTIGATFKHDTIDRTIKPGEHQENIDGISPFIPNLDTRNRDLTGYVNIRASCGDYLPMIGPIADYTQFKLNYQKLAQDAKAKIDKVCPYLPGLYLNVGHGSKGMLTAPISSEIIAQYINNELFTTSVELRQALHPNRFWIKEIIRNHKPVTS